MRHIFKTVLICLLVPFSAVSHSATPDLPPPPGTRVSAPPGSPIERALSSIPLFATGVSASVDGNTASAGWNLPGGVECSAMLIRKVPVKSAMQLDYEADIAAGKPRSPPLIPFPTPSWDVRSMECHPAAPSR